jgi:hypothetical protein
VIIAPRDLEFAAAGIVIGFLFTRYLAQRKKESEELAREVADDKEYWKYESEQEAIGLKYDPKKEWNEATLLPKQYLVDIRELNLRYRALLKRRNGWTDRDFE